MNPNEITEDEQTQSQSREVGSEQHEGVSKEFGKEQEPMREQIITDLEDGIGGSFIAALRSLIKKIFG